MITLSNVDGGTYVEVNDKFCEVSGFSRTDCIGKTALDFGWISPEERKRLFDELQTHGRVRDMDVNALTKDKRELQLIYSLRRSGRLLMKSKHFFVVVDHLGMIRYVLSL